MLAKDGGGFDRNPYDYDIVDNAVRAVLNAKPASPVGLLADGNVALTAFLPTDQAFRRLVRDLTGTTTAARRRSSPPSRRSASTRSRPCCSTTWCPARPSPTSRPCASNGAQLTTAQGGTITVRVAYRYFVKLVDADPDDANPYVVKANINKGNKQIAHGINQVLRPLNL